MRDVDHGGTALGGQWLTRPSTVVLLCLAVLGMAIPWQARWGMIPDTSWMLTVVERVLAGERLYVDIADTNPPFSTWLYMPPVLAGHALGIRVETAVIAYTYAACIVGLLWALAIARRPGVLDLSSQLPMVPLFLALLVLFPGNAFTQREHIGLALFLPLVMLAVWRSEPAGVSTTRPSLPLSITTGLAAGVIVLVKPYYVVMVLVAATFVVLRRRDPRLFLAPEYLSAAALCAAYLVAVLLFEPAFLARIYPLLADTYMRVGGGWSSMSLYVGLLAAWLVLTALLLRRGETHSLADLLALLALASFVPLFYQGKGWPYHAYPALALGIASLLCRMRQPGNATPVRRACVAAFIAAAAVPFMTSQRPPAAFVDAIRAAVSRPTVALLGNDIAVGHPLTRDIEGRWPAPYGSDWLGSTAAYLAWRAKSAGDLEEAARYDRMLDQYVTEKIAGLRSDRPDLLLVQHEDRIWLEILGRNPGFAAVWENYEPLATDGRIAAYIRVGD